jgi:glycoside/pentoside/hexuronide:cation symporter, GPH family
MTPETCCKEYLPEARMENSLLRLPAKTKLAYGVGDYGFALFNGTLGLLFAIYLTDVIGLSPSLAAAAVFLGRTWDYVNDPLFGFLSDRVRSRWGRRRPFLLLGFLPFGLTFALLWWRPPLETNLGLAVYFGLMYLLFDTTVTMTIMPYYALTPELTEDYDERTSLTTYRMVFSIIGTMTAFILPSALIGEMAPQNQDRIHWVTAGLAVLGSLPLLITFFGTRERMAYQELPKPKLLPSLRAAWECVPFRHTMGIFLFTFVGLELITTMLIFFLKYRMRLDSAFPIIAGSLFVVALLCLPFWYWLARKWNKRMAFIAGMLFMAGVMMLNALIQPQWGLPAMLVVAVLAGVGFSCIQVLPWAIIPDVVEWDEYHSGQRHEGIFYSLVTLLRKVANSLAIPAALLLLDWTGYIPNAAVQPSSAILAIVMVFSVVPAVMFLLGAFFARLLPITRETFQAVRDALELRRAAQAAASQD